MRGSRGLALLAVLCAAVGEPVRAGEAEGEGAAFAGVRAVTTMTEHLDGTPFKIPQGVYYDAAHDEVFVADTGNRRIGVFDGKGVPKFTFAVELGLEQPIAVTTDDDGNIYVLDSGGSSIAVFSYRGEPLRRIELGEPRDKKPVIASGMARGPDGLIYVIDGVGGRILVHEIGGEFVRVIRSTGSSKLRAPYDVAFDAEGTLYVSDRQGTPVQAYTAKGRYLRGWGRHDIGAEDFSVPSGIAVDPGGGNILVVDPPRQDIKVFSPGGEFLGRFGGFGWRAGQVAYPTDVAMGRGGRFYVVERVGRRVQIFEWLGPGNGGNGAEAPTPATVPENPPH